jgi:diguanylate cyclase (GGDEF)-like protein
MVHQQKLLIIDDSATVHNLARARLINERLDIHGAYDGEAGLGMARALLPDLILLDVDMPQPDGFEVCRRLKSDAATIGIPVVFMSGASSTEDKLRGLNLGAVDYVTKPFDAAELQARVRACLRTKYLLDLLAHRTMLDGLTGLWNRTYLDERLAAETALSSRNGQRLSCILGDVDHFQSLNERHGHPCGDEVLRALAQLFQQECRIEDVVGRYTGQQFLVVMPSIPLAGGEALARRLCQRSADINFINAGRAVPLTCSFGVAELSDAKAGGSSLLVDVEAALKSAKEAGRNMVVCATQDAAGLRFANCD